MLVLQAHKYAACQHQIYYFVFIGSSCRRQTYSIQPPLNMCLSVLHKQMEAKTLFLIAEISEGAQIPLSIKQAPLAVACI